MGWCGVVFGRKARGGLGIYDGGCDDLNDWVLEGDGMFLSCVMNEQASFLSFFRFCHLAFRAVVGIFMVALFGLLKDTTFSLCVLYMAVC